MVRRTRSRYWSVLKLSPFLVIPACCWALGLNPRWLWINVTTWQVVKVPGYGISFTISSYSEIIHIRPFSNVHIQCVHYFYWKIFNYFWWHNSFYIQNNKALKSAHNKARLSTSGSSLLYPSNHYDFWPLYLTLLESSTGHKQFIAEVIGSTITSWLYWHLIAV